MKVRNTAKSAVSIQFLSRSPLYLLITIAWCSSPTTTYYSDGFYHFNNLGYTLSRLAERHVDEEQLNKIFRARILQLLETKRFVKTYSRLSSQIRHSRYHSLSTLHKYFRNWRHSLASNYVYIYFGALDTFPQHSGDSYIAVFERTSLTNDAKLKTITYEMFLNFMSWVHLQEIHMLNPKNLSQGLTIDTLQGGQLTVEQVLEISVFILNLKRYSLAIEWMEILMQTDNFEHKRVDRYLIGLLYYLFAQQHNKAGSDIYRRNFESRLDHIRSMINLFTEPLTLNLLLSGSQLSTNQLSQRQAYFDHFQNLGSLVPVSQQLINICKGILHQSPRNQKNYKCYHDNKKNPYFYIQPLKIEHLADDPPLYQFYDVIDNKTIKWIKDQRIRELLGREDACGLTNNCQYGRDTPTKFFRIGEMITGLRFSNCPWHCQVTEYTVGKMRRDHSDHMAGRSALAAKLENLEYFGDYLATLLYYLEVPQGGGETPFMPVGLVGRPVRGSAIFWYNMYLNGSLRFDAIHGSCPVIHGEKMIVTNFFRYNVNWDRDKCTLNQME